MMMLRHWQSQAINTLVNRYENHRHSLVMATPGAGKTTMASVLAARLLDDKRIDIVICFTPSTTVCFGFKSELEDRIGAPVDGSLGARGHVLTYQSLRHQTERFWSLFRRQRVLVIFDEIHHCGGHDVLSATSWGQHIVSRIKNTATYTLALSGTPWRTDRRSVTLLEYCSATQTLLPDYIYPLTQAIKDGVCRAPRVVAIDNDAIVSQQNTESRTYSCLTDLMETENIPFQHLLEMPPLISYLIQQGVEALDKVRTYNPNAGGLIVASTVRHARALAEILRSQFNEPCEVITHHDPLAHKRLDAFKSSSTKWVISVGMISEGTDIPRLQVCCHLSRITTELHFRQVLGRVLRSHKNDGHRFAYLFLLAEKKLVAYAQRLADDLPSEHCTFSVERPHEHTDLSVIQEGETEYIAWPETSESSTKICRATTTLTDFPYIAEDVKENLNQSSYNISLYGRYLSQLMEIEADMIRD